jgi:hypothetical protein
MAVEVQELQDLLASSKATDEFKEAVRDLQRGRRPARISFSSGSPPVKVMRAITKLLEEEPDLPIASVSLEGRSGCSDFRGSMTVNDDIRYEFIWDCRWRAEQEGWRDAWGYPDQMKAAHRFGYQCFREFRRR